MNVIVAIAQVVLKEMIRRKDFYVLFILTALITGLLASVNFFNDPKIVRFLKEACLALIWGSGLVIAITTAARQIPAERESRTIFPLLAKPVTRAQVLTGKFLGCWLATGASLVVFYLFFTIVSGLKEGEWPVAQYFQAMWMQWVMLGVVVALTLLGSLIYTSPAETITIVAIVAVGILGLGAHLHKIALRPDQQPVVAAVLTAIYYVIPHLEFFDVRDKVVHGWELLEWSKVLLATLYGAGYMAVFLLLGWARFRRQRVN
ncbi:MAG: ABC transporter permease subunit [Verrucomicrobia bacterium]|nr:ABC transporter permease subunit [Verrucomicrobiota bacterium]